MVKVLKIKRILYVLGIVLIAFFPQSCNVSKVSCRSPKDGLQYKRFNLNRQNPYWRKMNRGVPKRKVIVR